ncbi:hypothetical protein BY996DRAFT_6410237 [Phakopsora pachyrhizi]|nr:hypothetical protein BY996DRAFT_6410237 [Phakopsora pachyrhizi]
MAEVASVQLFICKICYATMEHDLSCLGGPGYHLASMTTIKIGTTLMFTQNIQTSSAATNVDLTVHGGDKIYDGRIKGQPRNDVNDFLTNSILDDSVAILDFSALYSSFLIFPHASQSQKYSSYSTSSLTWSLNHITLNSTTTPTSLGYRTVAYPPHLSESLPSTSQNSLPKPDNSTGLACPVSVYLNLVVNSRPLGTSY